MRSQYWPGNAGFTEAFLYDGRIPGVGDFHYDDNGNLLDGAGRKLTWSSFDIPSSITNGVSSTFVYGAEHRRVRQDKSDGTSISYAGAMEVETKGGISTVKTYWPLGLGVEIDRVSGTDLNWTHLDRIGSIVAISDASGNLREQLAYESWGKRRALTGNATPDSLDGVTDNKGFTGHEMLDQLDLVHMNGRVYDPFIERFMSADKIIQDPRSSQSFNRYSYVWNNPTNLTDPTGFLAAERPANSVIPCSQDSRCDPGSSTTSDGGSESNSEIKTSNSPDNSGGAGNLNSAASGAKRELTLWRIEKNETGIWESVGQVDHVDTDYAALNGMQNEFSKAVWLMGDHITRAYGPGVTEFTLAYNPTHGFGSDMWEIGRDKLGITSQVTREFSDVLKDVQARGKKVQWVAHSQGGIIFAEAARIANASLSYNSVKFHSGGNNEFVTNRILGNRGINNMGYLRPSADPVPNIGGMNAINPFTLMNSLLHFPSVLWGTPETSPHTLPCAACVYEH